MPFTHFLADSLIDSIIADYATTYLALFTVNPTKSGGGTEVTGGSYARVAMDSDVIFDGASSSEDDSTDVVTFVTATASWGTVVGVGIYDASTSGNLLMWYPLITPVAIGNGDTYSFPTGNLIIRNA